VSAAVYMRQRLVGDATRGVVLKKEVGGQKKVGGRSDHIIVVKIPQKIYRE